MKKEKLPKYVVLVPPGATALHLGAHPDRALAWTIEDLAGRGISRYTLATRLFGNYSEPCWSIRWDDKDDRPIVIGPIATDGPLTGLRTVVTQAWLDGHETVRSLMVLGALPIAFPAIDFVPPVKWSAADKGIRQAGSYDWLAFTSKHAWDAFYRRMMEMKRDARGLPKIACIGSETANRMRTHGHVIADKVAKRFTAGALGKLMSGRVLHPTSDPHSPDFAIEARKRGATVVEPIIYRIVKPKTKGPPPEYDLVTFASSQTVRNFVEMTKPKRGTLAACIGPKTAATARELGFRVVVQPDRYTIPDLVKAIVRWRKKSK